MTSGFAMAASGIALEDDLAAIDGVEPVGVRLAVARFDSAIKSETPISLICRAASMNRLTTTGASPSNGSSSRRSRARASAPGDRDHLLLAA